MGGTRDTSQPFLGFCFQIFSPWRVIGDCLAVPRAGSGLLGMPYAFKEGGLVSGSVTILVVAVLSTYGVRLLLRVKRHMASSGQGALCSTFGSIAQHVLGVWGQRLVNAFLVSATSA